MIIPSCLPIIAPLILIGIWLIIGRWREKHARRQIGGNVVEVRLHQRWSIIMQIAATLGAATVLLAGLYMVTRGDGDAGEFVMEMLRASWIGSVVYGLRRQGRLLIGENGVAIGQAEMIPWEKVRGVAWDRDIGQRLWGVTVEVLVGKRIYRRRFYFRRDLKPEVERLMAELRPADSALQMPSPPSPRPSLR